MKREGVFLQGCQTSAAMLCCVPPERRSAIRSGKAKTRFGEVDDGLGGGNLKRLMIEPKDVDFRVRNENGVVTTCSFAVPFEQKHAATILDVLDQWDESVDACAGAFRDGDIKEDVQLVDLRLNVCWQHGKLGGTQREAWPTPPLDGANSAGLTRRF